MCKHTHAQITVHYGGLHNALVKVAVGTTVANSDTQNYSRSSSPPWRACIEFGMSCVVCIVFWDIVVVAAQFSVHNTHARGQCP